MVRFLATTFLLFASVACAADPVPEKLREKLKLDPFYEKYVDADGLPVIGSKKVSDDALAEAAWIVKHLLDGRKDIRDAMASQNLRAVIMAKDEFTTDVPEHSNLKPKLFWDRRARGLGATPHNPVVSGAEENLLSFHRDPYPNENIFLHEFAHAIHGTGLNKVDPTFDKRLRAAHAAAVERGLWKNTYAATNAGEYWAEGVQSWFDDNAPPDALHNDIRTRAKLKEYDKELAKMCEEVFGNKEWRYTKPQNRKPEDRAHLKNYDPKSVPIFRWRDAELGDKTTVSIQTALGDFEVELDGQKETAAVTNFVRTALDGGFHSGKFERVVGGGAWAVVNSDWEKRWAKDLKLEKWPQGVRVKPTNGSFGVMRDQGIVTGLVVFAGVTPEDATADVVVIGRVSKGAEVVKKLMDQPADAGRLKTPIDIRRVIRNQ
ncbi:MAG: peptidylprolyl isomerase [Fimbriiglobus sp.]|jgi:cyclophilin family peptidyl-prolyl cis-trans isomerase|nr:peptidylprolyl isomerase [Fimbriiglobus sp.]